MLADKDFRSFRLIRWYHIHALGVDKNSSVKIYMDLMMVYYLWERPNKWKGKNSYERRFDRKLCTHFGSFIATEEITSFPSYYQLCFRERNMISTLGMSHSK